MRHALGELRERLFHLTLDPSCAIGTQDKESWGRENAHRLACFPGVAQLDGFRLVVKFSNGSVMLHVVNEGKFPAMALALNGATHFRGFDSDHSHCQPLPAPGGMEVKIEYVGRRFLPVLTDDAGGTILQMLPRFA
jgi:hypothetical protein